MRTLAADLSAGENGTKSRGGAGVVVGLLFISVVFVEAQLLYALILLRHVSVGAWPEWTEFAAFFDWNLKLAATPLLLYVAKHLGGALGGIFAAIGGRRRAD